MNPRTVGEATRSRRTTPISVTPPSSRASRRSCDQGLVTFSGIADPAALTAAARRLMAIRPRRNAGPDGVTVITTPVLSTSTRRTDTASSVISAEASEGSRELAR